MVDVGSSVWSFMSNHVHRTTVREVTIPAVSNMLMKLRVPKQLVKLRFTDERVYRARVYRRQYRPFFVGVLSVEVQLEFILCRGIFERQVDEAVPGRVVLL